MISPSSTMDEIEFVDSGDTDSSRISFNTFNSDSPEFEFGGICMNCVESIIADSPDISEFMLCTDSLNFAEFNIPRKEEIDSIISGNAELMISSPLDHKVTVSFLSISWPLMP